MALSFPSIPGDVTALIEGDPDGTGTRTLELWKTTTAFPYVLRWQVASEPELYAEAIGDRLVLLPRPGVARSEIEWRVQSSGYPVSVQRHETDYVVLGIDDPVELWPRFQDLREELAPVGEVEAELIYRTPQLEDQVGIRGLSGDELSWIGARDAWANGLERPTTRVAVIDSGVDIDHPSLRNRLVPDSRGGLLEWNLVRQGTDPLDDDRVGHGTYCSGLIAGDPQWAFLGGVLRRGGVLPIKALDGRGMASAQRIAAAIHLAANSGATVISASWSNFSFSSLVERRIRQAGRFGTLFVTAAGNYGIDLDVTPSYPACYRLPNVLVVGGLTDALAPIPEGGIGRRTVHLSAPGQTVLSAEPTYQDPYDPLQELSGTSVATAIVAGCAALVQDAALFYGGGNLPPAEVKRILVQSTVSLDSRFCGVSCSRGYVNLRNAVGMVAGTYQPIDPPLCP